MTEFEKQVIKLLASIDGSLGCLLLLTVAGLIAGYCSFVNVR